MGVVEYLIELRSKNATRPARGREWRHLSPTQLAMVGARALGLRKKLADQAKERRRLGGETAGRGRPKQGMENFPHPIPDAGTTRDQIGQTVGVK
jgi:hypothetical protein